MVIYKVKLVKESYRMNELSKATFGAGCFWCVEAVFQQLQGVETVVSGYMGGHIKNPSYKEVCRGTTGHAEVCQIEYDPTKITFDELLEVLWTTHNPTTLNQQGADKGTQYRSAVYYHDEDQKAIAEKSKAEVATKYWDDPIVTEITEAAEFYAAEIYHQNYFKRNPTAGYCRVVISPKISKFKKAYATKLK